MTETKSDQTTEEPTPEAETAAPEAEAPAAEPRFNWEYREEFRINTRMREMLALTKIVFESEVERLRRKVEKLTYGS